jgi:hypothetical protein
MPLREYRESGAFFFFFLFILYISLKTIAKEVGLNRLLSKRSTVLFIILANCDPLPLILT